MSNKEGLGIGSVLLGKLDRYVPSVQAKFLTILLAPVVLISSFGIAVSAYLQYMDMAGDAQREWKRRSGAYGQLVAKQLWSYDMVALTDIVGVIAQQERVRLIEVIDNRGNIIHRQINQAASQQDQTIVLQVPLFHQKDQTREALGQARFTLERPLAWPLIKSNVIANAVLLLFVVAMLSIGAVFINRGLIIRPLRKLLDAIDASRRSGAYVKVAWSAADEFGQVSEGFNKMQDDLEARGRLLEFQSKWDHVTKLANRSYFERSLEETLTKVARSSTVVGLIFLDLDQFKWINDTFGHAIGDELLALVGERLQTRRHLFDFLARLGGDEFAIIFSEAEEIDRIDILAHQLLLAFATPFELADAQITVSASIGIAQYPADADNGDELLRHADMAMYQAKLSGRNCYKHFSPLMRRRELDHRRRQAEIRGAVERDAFVVHFQPIVNLKTGYNVGFEALIRMQRNGSLVMPDQFVPLAEELGLMNQIGFWVLRQALEQLNRWRADVGHPIDYISVNVSPLQLLAADFVCGVKEALTEYNLPPEALVLEVTENTLMEDRGDAVQTIHQLVDLGCRIAIDDFGKGYSSLSYLRRLPVSLVKIDKSFVQNIPKSQSDCDLLEAILFMGDKLGCLLIAEGIEQTEQHAFLRDLGCPLGQGWLFGRPGSAASLDVEQKGMRPWPPILRTASSRLPA